MYYFLFDQPVKSGLLGFGIRNTPQGIRNPTNDSNPESGIQVPVIRNPESTA